MAGQKSTTVVILLVLLSCTCTPCSGFFLETLTSSITNTVGTIFWEFVKLIIEGPTGLVIRALTYDYFGIQDVLWHLGWWGFDKAVKTVSNVGGAILWWSTTNTLDKFSKAAQWVVKTTWNVLVGGITNAVNFSQGTMGISNALKKLEKLKNQKILKKTDTITSSTAKPDGVNITVVIGRHIEDSNAYASNAEFQGLMNTLEEAFMTASHFDQHMCLPLVLCNIYADKPSLRTAQEAKLASLFELLLDVQPPPSWAKQHLQGVQLGIDSVEKVSSNTLGPTGSSKEAEKQNKRICRKAFPRCPYPVHVLRSLMAIVLESNSLSRYISENQAYFLD